MFLGPYGVPDAVDKPATVLIQIEVRLSPIVNVTFIFNYVFSFVS